MLAEGVGLDDVGAGLEILAVDAADDVGAGQHQQVVVAAQILRVIREALAAEIGLGERWRWIIVPIAPSRMRIRSREASMQRVGVRVILAFVSFVLRCLCDPARYLGASSRPRRAP